MIPKEELLKKISSSKNGKLLSELASETTLSRTLITNELKDENVISLPTPQGIRYFSNQQYVRLFFSKTMVIGSLKEFGIKLTTEENLKLEKILQGYSENEQIRSMTTEKITEIAIRDPKVNNFISELVIKRFGKYIKEKE
jgi:hypothetical protein